MYVCGIQTRNLCKGCGVVVVKSANGSPCNYYMPGDALPPTNANTAYRHPHSMHTM